MTSRWSFELTILLLETYLDRVDDFRDPTKKKRVLWRDLCNFINTNGTDFSPDTVERKFRNMKATYIEVSRTAHFHTSHLTTSQFQIKKRLDRTGEKKPEWPFYHLFEEIYSGDNQIDIGDKESAYEICDDANVYELAQIEEEIETNPNDGEVNARATYEDHEYTISTDPDADSGQITLSPKQDFLSLKRREIEVNKQLKLKEIGIRRRELALRKQSIRVREETNRLLQEILKKLK